SFLVKVQHFHAGVNEWLMIRNLHSEIFRWLPISRCERWHGSRLIAIGPGVLRVIKGNIAASRPFGPRRVFSPQGRGSIEDARSSALRRRISPFWPPGSL